MNFDPSTSRDHIVKLLGSKGVQAAKSASADKFKTHDEAYNNLRGGIPRKFDARKKWRQCMSIAEVRDQGHCGSCWVSFVNEIFTSYHIGKRFSNCES